MAWIRNANTLASSKCLIVVNLLKAGVAIFSIAILFACGDDASAESVVDIADEKMLVVSDVSELPDCPSENEGQEALVKGELSPRICIDGEWFLTYADSIGNSDFSCKAERLSDGSGLKIICNGDSIGVVLNGSNGAMGLQGVQGEKGDKGEKGNVGKQGVQGEKGDKGDTGAQGIQGEKGEKGDTGAQGIQGEKGDKGDTGAQGIQGEKGDKGDAGEQGIQGEKGEKGDTGAQGIQGEKGDKGDTGAQGIQGEKGDKGDAGAQGVQGEKGDKGDTGAQGVQGERGDKGDAGAQGAQGEKGDKGDTGEGCVIERKWNWIAITCGEKKAVIDVNEMIVNYNLGTCSSDNENVVGKSDNTYYICRSNVWTEATALEYDTYGKKCTKDGTVVSGDVVSANKYVCDAGAFRAATQTEISVDKGCVSYTVGKGAWKQPNHDSVFVCENGKWRGFKGVYTKSGTFVDARDDKTYKTVVIGSQMWMAEDLNYVDSLNYPSMLGRNLCYKTCRYCSCEGYGRYYTWSAAMDSVGTFSDNGKGCGAGRVCSPTYPVQGICPEGWHLPTQEEWKVLISSVVYVGKMLKSTTGWLLEGGNGADVYGFSAKPAGYAGHTNAGRDTVWGFGRIAMFWSSTDVNDYEANDLAITNTVNSEGVFVRDDLEYYDKTSKKIALPVRCVKNNCSGFNEGEVIQKEGSYYTCHSGAWTESSVLEYDTFGDTCYTDGTIVKGNIIPTNKYVCDAGVFRVANATEIALDKGCVSYMDGVDIKKRISTTYDSVYTCQDGVWVGTSIFTYGTLKDSRDSKTYRTTVIGNQTWMAENLNYADSAHYPSMRSRSSCYNDSCKKYGRLYTWSAVMDSVGTFSTNGKGCGAGTTCSVTYPVRGICPNGWHVPSNEELWTLRSTISQSTGGKKLKSAFGWGGCSNSNDRHEMDEYGFTALPNGFRYDSEDRYYDGYAFFYSSTEISSALVYFLELTRCGDGMGVNTDYGRNRPKVKQSQFSLRCLKD